MLERRLTEADRENLASYEWKMQLVADQTTLCAMGYWTGLYLHGAGGTGRVTEF
jgi:hypothetical protein